MSLFAINAGANGASTGYYCSVTLTSGTLVDGVGQSLPTQASYTYMSFQGAIAFQVAPGDAACGGTVSTTTDVVAGSVLVSPPINVPMTITLWGRGSVIGTYSLPAGQESGQFSFNAPSNQSIPPEEVKGTIEKTIKPPNA
jgi:hypothetical protein